MDNGTGTGSRAERRRKGEYSGVSYVFFSILLLTYSRRLIHLMPSLAQTIKGFSWDRTLEISVALHSEALDAVPAPLSYNIDRIYRRLLTKVLRIGRVRLLLTGAYGAYGRLLTPTDAYCDLRKYMITCF